MASVDESEARARIFEMLRSKPFPNCKKCGKDMHPTGPGSPRDGAYCHICGACVCRKCLKAPYRKGMACPECGSDCFEHTSETFPYLIRSGPPPGAPK